jgi:hypothetical protein
LFLKNPSLPEVTNHREQIQGDANNKYGDAEQDANSKTPHPKTLPEVEAHTEQPYAGATYGTSQQKWVVRLFL